MIIRKIRRNEIVSKKKIFKRAILLFILVIIGKGFFSRVSKESTLLMEITPQQVGETVHIAGSLSSDNNFPHYTHSIVDAKGNSVGIKSVSVNLNAYKGKVEVVGKVEKFLKRTPIVEVKIIKLPDQGLIIKDNKYYFTDEFLYIDLSSQPQLSATLSGRDVLLLFANTPVVAIQRFLCPQILKGKSCDALINEYRTSRKDNFESYAGDIFYKHTTDVWTTFDGNTFGYVFKNIDDDTMLNISSMISMVNKDFIIKNKLPIIQEQCQNEEESLKTIESSKIQYGNAKSIPLTIKGESTRKNKVQCTITFDTRNEWKVTKSSFGQQ